jgi:hypothetical protein
LADIRATRSILHVIQEGRVIDRDALLTTPPEAAAPGR